MAVHDNGLASIRGGKAEMERSGFWAGLPLQISTHTLTMNLNVRPPDALQTFYLRRVKFFSKSLLPKLLPNGVSKPANLTGGRDGTGRHARFRFLWRKPCGFESHRPHSFDLGLFLRKRLFFYNFLMLFIMSYFANSVPVFDLSSIFLSVFDLPTMTWVHRVCQPLSVWFLYRGGYRYSWLSRCRHDPASQRSLSYYTLLLKGRMLMSARMV